MTNNSCDVEKLGLSRTQIHSLEDELGKLKVEHLACDVERRRFKRELELKNEELENLTRKLGFSKDTEAMAITRYNKAVEYNREVEAKVEKLMEEQLAWDFERRKLERKLEVKNDELENLTKKLGFSKDAEADAIKRYEQALEYNREMEAKVEELKRGFDKERGELLGKLNDLKDELMEREVELEADSAPESHVNDVKCSSKSRNRKEFAKPTVLPEGKIGENGVACNHKRKSPVYVQISGSGDVSGDASNHNDDSSSDASDHEQEAEQTNIKIYVRFLYGKMITMSVEPALTIYNLKSKIQEKEGIPTHTQLLLFEGKELKHSRTLAQCNIQKESIIDLEFRLRRGIKI